MAQSMIRQSDIGVQQQSHSESIHSVTQVIVRGVRMTITVKEFEVHTSDGAVEHFILIIPSIEDTTITGPPKPKRKRPGSKPKDLLPSSQKVRTFPCHNCPKTFTSGSMLKRHLAVHNGSFCCPEAGCESRYRNQTALTKHQVAEHGLLGPLGKRLAKQGTRTENISLSQSPLESSSTMTLDNHNNESNPDETIRSLTVCTTDDDSADPMEVTAGPSSSGSTDETKSPTIAEMTKQLFTLCNLDFNSMVDDDDQFLNDNALLGKLFDDFKFDFEIFTNEDSVLLDDTQDN